MRGLAVLLGAVLLCGIAILAWSTFANPDASVFGTGTDPQAASADSEAPTQEALTGATDPKARDATATAIDAVTSDRDTRERLTPTAAEDTTSSGRKIKVTCFIKATGEPAAETDLLFSDPGFDSKNMSAADKADGKRLRRDREAWLRRFGKQARTDDTGTATLLLGESKRRTYHLEVCARLGNLFGQIYIQISDDTLPTGHRVLLEPDLELSVQTKDSQRNPVPGVPIAIRRQFQDDWFDTATEYTSSVGKTEGTDATLVIRHLQRYVTGMSHHGPRRIRVCLHVPGHDLVGRDVDLNALPSEPIQLVVPPTGRVEITSVDRLGKLLEGYRYVQVSLAGHTKPTVNEKGVRVRPTKWDLQQYKGKPATLSHVGLGLQLEATVGYPWGGDADRKTFDGPTRPGELVSVKIRGGGSAPTLVGRVVGPDGSPVPDTKLACEIYRQQHKLAGRHRPKTDSKGCFHVQLERDQSSADIDRVRIVGLDKESKPRGLDAICLLTGAVRPGQTIIDLGDVQLLETPLVVAGQLVGDGDLSRVWLSVDRVTPSDAGGRPNRVRQQGIETLRMPDKKFELRGRPGPGTLQLSVSSKQHLVVPPRPFVTGERNLKIHLQTGGGLLAMFRWQDYEGYWALKTRLTPLDPTIAAMAAAASRSPLQPSQNFEPRFNKEVAIKHRWSSLWPGSYRLEVLLYGVPKPLAVVDDIVVREGEVTKGGRLDLDLSKLVHKAMLILVDADDKPIGGSRGSGLAVLLDGDQPAGPVFSARWGWVCLVGTQPSFDVRLIVPGYRPKIVRGITKKTRVKMERGLPLRLRLASTTPSLPRGEVVWVTLETARVPITGAIGSSFLDSGGEADLGKDLSYPAYFTASASELSMHVPVAGRYRIKLQVGPKPRRGYYSRSVKGPPVRGVTPTEITVRDTSTPQRFELRVPDGAWPDK